MTGAVPDTVLLPLECGEFCRDFLRQCAHSTQGCFEAFQVLLGRLEDPQQRVAARLLLQEIIHAIEPLGKSGGSRFFFDVRTLQVPLLDGSVSLVLLQFPSVFAPEDWSFTFFEGLLRYDPKEFISKNIVELGCGNGWITLATALRSQSARNVGLDLNPKAVLCAQINAYLNGLDAQGNTVTDPGGTPLLDKVQFYTSDLLAHPIEKKEKYDFIFGCIPQVLNPKKTVTPVSTSAHLVSDEDLYDLSNYTTPQGMREDEFGLGLIARALEESVDVLLPNGRIVFNMGGRPGEKLIENLFKRRGFLVKKIWQCRVQQAQDTDISPLVEREQIGDHRFEFFSSETAQEPLCAATAQCYLEAGGSLFHALTVYEAALSFPHRSQKIFHVLRNSPYQECRDYLDLNYDLPELVEEKMTFLGILAENLERALPFPYSDTLGDPAFLKMISLFLKSYFKIGYSLPQLGAFPSRVHVVQGLLAATHAQRVLIDTELYKKLFQEVTRKKTHTSVTTSIEEKAVQFQSVVPVPRNGEITADLMSKIKPDLVVCALADFENITSDTSLRLIDLAEKHGSQLVFDLSHHLDLSSQPRRMGAIEACKKAGQPAHVALMAGLIKNRIYPDLRVAFLASTHQDLMVNLERFSEISHSRTPLMNQWFYQGILTELLNFQMLDWRQKKFNEASSVASPARIVGQTETAKACGHPSSKGSGVLRCHPAFSSPRRNPSTIRLDYGENALGVSPFIKSALLSAFCQKDTSLEVYGAQKHLRSFLLNRFGLQRSLGNAFFTAGVAPLFSALCGYLKEQGRQVCFPNGAYGYFDAALRYHDVPLVPVVTHVKQGFKVMPDALAAVVESCGRSCVYLNAPICNPSGARFFRDEINEIISLCEKNQALLVIDAVFSGLTFNEEDPLLLEALNGAQCSFVLMGGVSKEWACGGLRLGYALTNDPEIEALLRCLAPPHSTLVAAAGVVYAALCDKDAALVAFFDAQRRLLRERASVLGETLNRRGWHVVPPEGGLFLVAKEPYEGAGKDLFLNQNILVNSPQWIGISDHCRFVIAVTEREFAEAIHRL